MSRTVKHQHHKPMKKCGEFEVELGKRLQEERFRLGYNLRDVALKTGVSATGICQIENGVRSPKFKTMMALSSFYGVTLNYWIS